MDQPTRRLDELDTKIVELLRKDPRMTAREVARALSVPDTTAGYRILKLEKEGLVELLRLPIENMVLANEQRIARVDADVGDQWRLFGQLQRRIEALELRITKLERLIPERPEAGG